MIEIPLAHLLEPTAFREEEWEREGVKRAVLFVSYGEDVVWGTTGRILREVLDALVSGRVTRGEGRPVTYETLLVDVRDGVATLTLNRPEARNALNPTLVRELGEALPGWTRTRMRAWSSSGARASARSARAPTSRGCSGRPRSSRRGTSTRASRGSWRPSRGCGRR